MTDLWTMKEVAGKLKVSRRWLQTFIKQHPYYHQAGHKKLFTEEDITRLIGAMRCPGTSPHRAPAKRRSTLSVDRTVELYWTERARAQRTNARPNASSQRGASRRNVVNLPPRSPRPSPSR